MAGLTLDSGALIAFERQDRTVIVHLKEALQRGADVTVPTVVVAEAWRGGPRAARVASLLATCRVEPLGDALARRAGETLARVSSGAIDAVVMASAAGRGDLVLTSDFDDLSALRACFPTVRLARI